MGVTQRIIPYHFQSSEDELELIEDYVNAPDSRPATPPARGRRGAGRHRNHQVLDDKLPLRRAKTGIRQARRIENLNYLFTLVEEGDVPELTFVELTEPGISAFAELFMEEEKMMIWNDFISKSEEEQMELLQQCGAPVAMETEQAVGGGQAAADDGTWEDLGQDKRAVHPAFSVKACFERIDSNLRNFLRKRQLPLGTLQHLEEEVTSFFSQSPTAVFVSHLPSSFERMLLHALSQYLDLLSRSSDNNDGSRLTMVENRKEYFEPPVVTLTQFLDSPIHVETPVEVDS